MQIKSSMTPQTTILRPRCRLSAPDASVSFVRHRTRADFKPFRLVERARGEIVHILHGDDYVLPGYYEALDRGLRERSAHRRCLLPPEDRPTAKARSGLAQPEKEHSGASTDSLAHLASEQRIVTPAIAVRRKVSEKLGGFDPRLRCAEDWEMWVRIAAHYDVWYEPRPLAAYRRHDRSNTSANSRNAAELRYSSMAIILFAPLLPRERARRISRMQDGPMPGRRCAMRKLLLESRTGEPSRPIS